MITARNLARTFTTRSGPVEAVRGVDIDVAEGEIVGLLGPNGAGKTTTLRMLTTLLGATGGEATVAGHDLRRDPRGVRSSIGYVAQGGASLDEAVVIEELVLQARLFGLSKTAALVNAEELVTTFGLRDLRQRACKQLSGGQRRRVDISLGLVHRPRLIFLDEPTTGLDPQSRTNLWEHIRKLRAGGVTIVLTTHYLDEADALCDRVLVMDQGTIVAEGSPDELKQRITGDIVTIELAGTEHVDLHDEHTLHDDTFDEGAQPGRPKLHSRTDDVVQVARAAVDVRSTLVEHHRIHVTVDRGDQSIIPLLRALDAAGINIAAITMKRPSLDDVFLTVTGRSLSDAEQDVAPAAA
ncbi:ATP-binding cassette domain-containing protein [Phytoactinopolyspora limicola]|uniref:ATP-binding cassette domain-containing protein n=1 Tax=Phytoactinopolyspora limicola TaxID=2715536 RepID=UPI0014073405|nr:ATP-binding cassette domain-containing protein [Phytoactinopolyspora limicola]